MYIYLYVFLFWTSMKSVSYQWGSGCDGTKRTGQVHLVHQMEHLFNETHTHTQLYMRTVSTHTSQAPHVKLTV